VAAGKIPWNARLWIVKIVREVHLLIGRHEAGLPLVRVNDGRPLPREARELERRAAEYREAPCVVRIISVSSAVQTFTIEQVRRIHEDSLHAGCERLPGESNTNRATGE
jgi:hypothetical protein